MPHNQQLSFSSLEQSNRRKKTAREEFLAKMDNTVPWEELTELIRPHYHSNTLGRPCVPLECMLRMYFLQVWFSLSDRDTEDALNDIISMRDFSRMDFSVMEPPDATTLLNFRRILEANNLCAKIFERVKSLLLEKGLMWKGGTILDATIISASKSVKNEKHERDKDMGSTYKYGCHYFGAKAHIGVDSGTGYVHSVEVTSASKHDITQSGKLVRADDDVVKGDSGYIGLAKRDEIAKDFLLSKKKYEAVPRPSSTRKLGLLLHRIESVINKTLIRQRQKVEYPFHVLKNLFKFRKLPFRGMDKNRSRLLVLFASINIYMLAIAGRSFKVPFPEKIAV